MSKQREALKLALEALEDYQANGAPFFKCDSAVSAIREALTEPEQEPVAWAHQPPGMSKIYSIEPIPGPDSIPLYTTPPARKPLTDYQVREIDELVWKELSYEEKTFGQFALKMARAIERAHGIGSD